MQGIESHRPPGELGRIEKGHELRDLMCLVRHVTVGEDCGHLMGSDQIFARVVLECGGILEVILPATDYRERKVKLDNLAEFDDLIGRARVVQTLPFGQFSRDAYMAASEEVLDSVDSLIAVWDGNSSEGYSGTADVVAAARERGIPVTVVWPDGARRE